MVLFIDGMNNSKLSVNSDCCLYHLELDLICPASMSKVFGFISSWVVQVFKVILELVSRLEHLVQG